MPDPEFVSIIDCELCRAIPRSDKVNVFGAPSEEVAPPLPPSWARLSTIAVLARFRVAWGCRDELRMCPYCGTYYEYGQLYESGDVLEAESTDWYLNRVTPLRAAALLGRAQPRPTGSESANVERRYQKIMQTLRFDLGRIQNEANVIIKTYVIAALVEHDLAASDWDTLKTTLLDHPDPAVRVGAATKVVWPVLLALGRDKVPGVAATAKLITKKRRQALVAVLAEGLSHDDKIAPAGLGDEPARTDLTALNTLGHCASYVSLAVAIPALATWLAGDDAWRRAKVRDLLIIYVDQDWRRDRRGPATAPRRASEVLAPVSAIDTEEARAVARHCRTVLGLPVDSA